VKALSGSLLMEDILTRLSHFEFPIGYLFSILPYLLCFWFELLEKFFDFKRLKMSSSLLPNGSR
jgi:hypothetical protein